MIEDTKELLSSTKINSNRNLFFKDFNTFCFDDVVKKYFPNNFKVKIEKFFRKKLVNLSCYNKIKMTAKKILKR